MRAIKKKSDAGNPINYTEYCSVNSYKGWLKWCDSHRLSLKYLIPIQEVVDKYYQNNIKRKAVTK